MHGDNRASRIGLLQPCRVPNAHFHQAKTEHRRRDRKHERLATRHTLPSTVVVVV